MEIIDRIRACTTSAALDDLRDEIHEKASHNEIDFKFVKAVFLKKKAELEGVKKHGSKRSRRR